MRVVVVPVGLIDRWLTYTFVAMPRPIDIWPEAISRERCDDRRE